MALLFLDLETMSILERSLLDQFEQPLERFQGIGCRSKLHILPGHP
jgi:hypothetical protein